MTVDGGKNKNAAVGHHALLQGIFLTQESKLGLLRCSQILLSLSHLVANSDLLGSCLVSITFRGNLMFNYGMLTQIPFRLF